MNYDRLETLEQYLTRTANTTDRIILQERESRARMHPLLMRDPLIQLILYSPSKYDRFDFFLISGSSEDDYVRVIAEHKGRTFDSVRHSTSVVDETKADALTQIADQYDAVPIIISEFTDGVVLAWEVDQFIRKELQDCPRVTYDPSKGTAPKMLLHYRNSEARSYE